MKLRRQEPFPESQNSESSALRAQAYYVDSVAVYMVAVMHDRRGLAQRWQVRI